MKTAEVRNVTWKMNDDVYAWHRRLNSFEVGDNSIWNWHPIIGSEMASFIYLCMEREPKCFIDIGAHCGVFSSVYCSLVDNHQCYSIEPVKEHMDRLEDTAKLNEWNLTTHKIGLNKGNKRKIIQYDLEMNEIQKFNKIKDASIQLAICYSSIKAVLYKKQNTAGGFIFNYLEE